MLLGVVIGGSEKLHRNVHGSFDRMLFVMNRNFPFSFSSSQTFSCSFEKCFQ